MSRAIPILQSIVVFGVFVVAISYYFVIAHATEIKNNWSARKCDPRVIPFAGLINAPKGTSAADFAAMNFSECLASTGKIIARDAIAPAQYLVSGLNSAGAELTSATQSGRGAINQVRGAMQGIANAASTRTYNTALPLVHTTMKTKSSLQKTQAVGGIGLFSSEGLLLSTSATVGAFVEFLLIMAGIMIATSGALLAIPFCLGCPLGIPMLALGLATMGICIAVIAIVMPKLPTSGL